MSELLIGTRVRMLQDSPASEDGEFFYRKGDIGIVISAMGGWPTIDFNGVEGQAVLDDGVWVACRHRFEVLP